jgi:hypothetical protein
MVEAGLSSTGQRHRLGGNNDVCKATASWSKQDCLLKVAAAALEAVAPCVRPWGHG